MRSIVRFPTQCRTPVLAVELGAVRVRIAQHGWALVPGVGKGEMVPPDDAGHPKRAQGTECVPLTAIGRMPP